MEYSPDYINNLIEKLTFGEVALSDTEKNIYDKLNGSFITLGRNLPDYMQNSAMIFLFDYFRIRVGEPPDFLHYYYKPLWTIILRITESGRQSYELAGSELETVMLGEAMSLFLHSLDDHLNDGDIPSSHLTLLLRSQAWLLLNKAVAEFENGKEGQEIAYLLINDYYTGICDQNQPADLDEYCARFRKEMSLMNIMPLLAAHKITKDNDFTEKIKYAMESFGIAWRILDDIQDAEKDIAGGTHTALYHALPQKAKKLWDAKRGSSGRNARTDIRDEIYRELAAGRIFEALMERIVRELGEARKTVEALGIRGMAGQYREIGAPIEDILNKLKAK